MIQMCNKDRCRCQSETLWMQQHRNVITRNYKSSSETELMLEKTDENGAFMEGKGKSD